MCNHKINAFFHVGGRKECWDKFSKFLERQTYPHENIKLILVNTSPKHQYYKEWLDRCDYQYAYHEKNLNSSDREGRLTEICINQVAILNANINGEYLCTLDDDTIPPLDVISKLLPHFNTDNTFAVSACYRLAPRIGKSNYYCCWPINHNPLYYTKSKGIQVVGGACYGCCLFKLKDCKLMWSMGQDPYAPNDVAIFRRIHALGGITKVDWDTECDHLADDGNNPFPTVKISLL